MSMIINPFRFGGPPAVSGTNWRVNFTKTGYSEAGGIDSIQIAEMEMRQSAGGADECTGGTATAVNGTASSAFDNNTNTTWRGVSGPSWWLQYAHSASKNIVEISIRATGDRFSGDGPTEFTLQTNDGSIVDVKTFKTGPWGVGETRVFNVNTWVDEPQKFIRLRPTGVHGGFQPFITSAVEFRTTSGGSNIATGGTPFCRDHSAPYPPSNAYDGDAATWYEAGSFGGFPNQYIGYHLTSAIGDDVVEVALTCLNQSFGPNCAPTGFHVEYGSGNVWTNLWTETSIPTWTQGQTRVFTKP